MALRLTEHLPHLQRGEGDQNGRSSPKRWTILRAGPLAMQCVQKWCGYFLLLLRPGSLRLHRALLKVSRNPSGIHLVTTNYDDNFARAQTARMPSNSTRALRFRTWTIGILSLTFTAAYKLL